MQTRKMKISAHLGVLSRCDGMEARLVEPNNFLDIEYGQASEFKGDEDMAAFGRLNVSTKYIKG